MSRHSIEKMNRLVSFRPKQVPGERERARGDCWAEAKAKKKIKRNMQKYVVSSQEYNLRGPFPLPSFAAFLWFGNDAFHQAHYLLCCRSNVPEGMPFNATRNFRRPRWSGPRKHFPSKKKEVYLPSVDSLREIPAKMRPCALRSFGWQGGGGQKKIK